MTAVNKISVIDEIEVMAPCGSFCFEKDKVIFPGEGYVVIFKVNDDCAQAYVCHAERMRGGNLKLENYETAEDLVRALMKLVYSVAQKEFYSAARIIQGAKEWKCKMDSATLAFHEGCEE